MTTIALNLTNFRAMFPAFANTTTFPDAMVTLYWGAACDYIEADDCVAFMLNGTARELALMQMTAHLMELGAKAAKGIDVGPIENSKVDKIDVKLAQRPATNMWQWWLSSTAYGKQLLGLLEVSSVGGLYIGGSPERAVFRRGNGWLP